MPFQHGAHIPPVGGKADPVAVFFQVFADQRPDFAVVIDDEYV